MAHNIKTIKEQFKKAGVFHTDEALALLMRERVGECKRVYDPTCGDGALLAVFPDDVEKYGQEINPEFLSDAEARLKNFHGYAGDTLTDPAFADIQFDAIVANPPFSIAWTPTHDPRFDAAPVLAPKSKADYAFILHVLSKLTEDGTAAVLCSPGVLYRGNAEGKIRKWLVENGHIWRVERIPGGHFVDTPIETALLTIRRKPCTSITFVDTVENLSRDVPLDEVAGRGYQLSVGAYVEKPLEPCKSEPMDTAKMEAEIEDTAIEALRQQLKIAKVLQEIDSAIDAEKFARRIIETVQAFLENR